MNLCEAIFKKHIYDLLISDVIEYFSTPQEETSVLEFKSGAVQLETIYREVGAFLNTEGGILIIGAPKEIKDGNGKRCQGELVPCNTISDYETMMRSIFSNITPTPTGIKIKSFILNNGKVFIIEIPQSQIPPHQVSKEGKYYIRLETEARPAPHGVVEALFNRRQSPNLVADVYFYIRESSDLVQLTFLMANKSLISAEHVGVIIEVDGVRDLLGVKNLTKQPNRVDDKVIINEAYPNTILAQGASLTIKLDITLRKGFGFLSFSYYCRNTKMEIKEFLFESSPHSIIMSYDSKVDPVTDHEDAIVKNFRSMNEDWMRQTLLGKQPNQNTLFLPATVEQINDLTGDFRIDLPESLVQFLLICNGYKGIINDLELILFDVESLADEKKIIAFELKSYILIGYVQDFEIYIEFEGNETFTFKWESLRGYHIVNNSTTSLYGFLEFLLQYKPC